MSIRTPSLTESENYGNAHLRVEVVQHQLISHLNLIESIYFGLTTKISTPMTNNEPCRNPTTSSSAPDTVGPTKFPSANMDNHTPEMSPYVLTSSGNPLSL